MINHNLVHIVEKVHLVEEEVLTHLPDLHGHLDVNGHGFKVILLERTPSDIFNIVLLVEFMREDHLWGAILIVVTGLLLPALIVVPYENLAIRGRGHEEVLAGRRPFNLIHWALVVGQVVDEVLEHAPVPNVQDS
jgi:hypothetical protein